MLHSRRKCEKSKGAKERLKIIECYEEFGEKALACCRYVELNPLRAGMVEDPSQYPWSSCPVKTGIKKQSWLDFDPFYMSLGITSNERAKKYGNWLRETVPEGEWKVIREAIQRGQLTSDRKFKREISEKLCRRIELRGPGRPKQQQQKKKKKK